MKNLIIREVKIESYEFVTELSAKSLQGKIVITFVSHDNAAEFLDSQGQVNEFELMKAIYNFLPKSIEV